MTDSRVCPACGSLEAGDASFCSRCGQPLAERAPRERRALVSIVFCDLVGSTALGERLDAEVLRGVQERYFAVSAAALRAHGGQVEKYIGDAVMCVFGLPAANEDDALRAVRGALELVAGVEQLNVGLRSELGVELAVRIGVNTGEVVAGDHTTGQALVTGDTVNTAARLEQAAHAGGILIGAVTHRLVARSVEAEPADPITAKGKSEPLPAWRVLGLRRTIPASPDGSSRLVGRKGELEALRGRFAEVTGARRAGLVILSGDAGIGKTRLLAEFASGLTAGRVVFGACPSYGRGNTYRPLRDVLDALAPFTTQESVAALVGDQPDAQLVARRLLVLTGHESDLVSREEGFGAVARLFASLAAEGLVVVVDDLHWAEPTFLDLLEFLEESLQAGVLLVGTAREELFEERPDLATRSMRLAPLGAEAAGELVAQRGGLSAEESRRVVARADGNPLFLEQLGAAFEEGAESVPPDIASLLAARLDRLDAQPRGALEAAAIVGRDFWPGALTSLLDDEEGVRALDASLELLTAKELVGGGASGTLAAPTGLSGVFSGERMHFRHALVHDSVLSALPKLRRAALHERFAANLAEYADHEPAVVGYHLEQAARLRMELRPRDAPPPAAEAAAAELELAGRQALERDDAPAASLLLSRAKALLPDASPEAARIDALFERSVVPRSFAAAAELSAGDELGGFVIESVAGRGGMAVVYRARDPQLERSVALKVIAPALADELSFRARFVRESRIAASIHHPAVIPVYGAGEARGRLYIAMRYVQGGDLAARIHERGALPVHEAVTLTEKLAGALDAAHGRGLVHRDVKPANALLEGDQSDRVYLTDFGLSSDRQALSGLTKVGEWVGTVAYSAPEQVRGEQVDARADVYALGGLLFTLLAGAVPFPANSEAEALAAHLHEPPPRPSRLAQGIPRGLDAVVARAMDKDPARRYPSAGDLARAATAAARGDRVPADQGSVASGSAAPQAGARLRPAARRRTGLDRRLVFGGGAAVVAAVALAAFAATQLAGSGNRGSSNPAGQVAGSAIALPIGPGRISIAGDAVWALQRSAGLLARVDKRTRKARAVPEPYDLGGNEHPDIAAGAGVAWVTSAAASEGGVDRVPESDHGLEPIHVPFGSASAVAVGPGAVWATSDPGADKDGSIVRIDPKTGRIAVRRTMGRRAVDVAFAGGALWVALQSTGEVLRLDPTSLKQLGRVRLGAGISRLAADGATLWVLNKANRTVSRIDARRATSVGVPIALGKELQDIAAGGGSLWIAGSDRTLTRVGADGAVIGTPIAVGAAPLSLAGDGADVWVASGSDNSLVRVSSG